jgi:hypothetical protein
MPESTVTQFAIYTARPTIRIDGQENDAVNELITGMEVHEAEGGLSSLELRLSNVSGTPDAAELAFEDNSVLKLGAAITVYAGEEIGPTEIFRGTITALEARFSADSPELVVLAEDKLQLARMARRTKIHDNLKIADLVRDVAGQLGLTPVITGLAQDIGVQAQLDESDLAFLRRLLARRDADMQVVGGELHASPRASVNRGTLKLELHGQLREARALADLAHQVTTVTVSGWDAAQGQRVSASSTGANAGPGRGRKGAEILRQTLGDRAEHIAHLAVTTSDEANAVADAAFDRSARRFVCVEGKAEGNPALRVGAEVELTGLGARFDNTYYVTAARHQFDQSHGYETHFEAESAYWLAP